jgi:cytochrome c553
MINDGRTRRLYPWMLAAIASCGLVATGGALAAQTPDFELGRYLSSECMTCHRAPRADGAIPNIFGLTQQHLSESIRNYRDKRLPNEVMQNVASRLTDEEIASLALFFSRSKKP